MDKYLALYAQSVFHVARRVGTHPSVYRIPVIILYVDLFLGDSFEHIGI